MQDHTSTKAASGIHQRARLNRMSPPIGGARDSAKAAGTAIAINKGTGEMPISRAVGSQLGVAPSMCGTSVWMVWRKNGTTGRQNMNTA